MKIKFTNYKNGLHQFNFKTDVRELGIEENFSGTVLLGCEMDKSSTQIIFNCELQLKTKYNCDRCTVDFSRDIETSFKIVFFITHSKENSEDDESGIHYLSPDDDKIDLTNDTVENALLTVPMKVLCSEDCKGLCYVCGCNKNKEDCDCKVDKENPVWEKLLNLKGKLN